MSEDRTVPLPVVVHKLNLQGDSLLSYTGVLLSREAGEVVLEAHFSRERMALDYVTLKPGDRFVEYFYADRWYNVFAIYDVDDGRLKGWYCNITRPAEISGGAGETPVQVRAVDLALDYFRQPSGAELVLDEAEFAALALDPAEREAASAALAELRRLAAQRSGPFALR